MSFTSRGFSLRVLAASLAIIWMALIYYISDQPSVSIGVSLPGLDKVLHAGAYGLLAGLWLLAMPHADAGYALRFRILAAMISSLYGATDEWHQSFVPGRHTEFADFLADALGAFLAVWLLHLWFQRRSVAA